jgi:hypothetical protein
MTRLQFVAFLTALYSHKLSNSKFEGYTLQAERFAHFETGVVNGSQPNLFKGNYDEVAQFECTLAVKRITTF